MLKKTNCLQGMDKVGYLLYIKDDFKKIVTLVKIVIHIRWFLDHIKINICNQIINYTYAFFLQFHMDSLQFLLLHDKVIMCSFDERLLNMMHCRNDHVL